MDFQPLHDWPSIESEAIAIQNQLRSKINIDSKLKEPNLICAVDTAFNTELNRLYSVAVIMTFPGFENVERASAQMRADFPYIPALLAFREGPVILKALSRLETRPDLLVFSGHGLAHPRRFGMAAHLGLITDIPSIGCARKCLAGNYLEPGKTKGSLSTIYISDKKVGFALRTKSDVKPMFVSPGHKCSLADAIDIINKCITTFRMPVPLRLAHLYASKYKNDAVNKKQRH